MPKFYADVTSHTDGGSFLLSTGLEVKFRLHDTLSMRRHWLRGKATSCHGGLSSFPRWVRGQVPTRDLSEESRTTLLTVPELWPSPRQKHCLHVPSGSESLPREPAGPGLGPPPAPPSARRPPAPPWGNPPGGRGGPRVPSNPRCRRSSLLGREPRRWRGWWGGQSGRRAPSGRGRGRGGQPGLQSAPRCGGAERGRPAGGDSRAGDNQPVTLPRPGRGERALNPEGERTAPPGGRGDAAAGLGSPQDQPLSRVLRGPVGDGARKYLPGGLTGAGGPRSYVARRWDVGKLRWSLWGSSGRPPGPWLGRAGGAGSGPPPPWGDRLSPGGRELRAARAAAFPLPAPPTACGSGRDAAAAEREGAAAAAPEGPVSAWAGKPPPGRRVPSGVRRDGAQGRTHGQPYPWSGEVRGCFWPQSSNFLFFFKLPEDMVFCPFY